MEANVATTKKKVGRQVWKIFIYFLFYVILFHFEGDFAVQREWRGKQTFDATAELCDAFVVVASPQVSGVPEEQLLVFLYPGLPTTAELFILPDENGHGEHKKDSEEALETVRKREDVPRNV